MIRRDFLLGLSATATLAAVRSPISALLPPASSLLSKGLAKTSLGDAYFEIHGNPQGSNLFMAGPVFSRTPNPANVALQTQIKHGYISRLGDRYKLLMSDYPHIESKTVDNSKALSVEDVCHDYLAIADAAGMERFAAIGYSWGGNTVLQLATRSQRVVGLVVGGWPAIDGPYNLLLQTTQQLQKEHPDRPEIARYVNYYKSLQRWPERAEVAKLTCPKLNFIDADDADDPDFIGRFRKNKEELHKLGWETAEVNSGHGHAGGLMPDVACPVIRTFLDKHFAFLRSS
jgi:pimeloyl-ACP methyl ester carboxylesterase